MRSLIISMFLLLVLVFSQKHAFTEPLPGVPHIEIADVFYAPMFNDTGVFGAFGGYLGGDSSNQLIDWSIGNTIPHSGSMTDDIVFSTSIGSFMNSANWFERMRITKNGNVGIGTASPVDLLEVASDTFAGVTLSTYSSAGADNPSELALRRARGTMAAPSAILSGDVIGWIFGDGYGATTWPDIGPGINFVATENWTDTALGSRIGFYTIQNGTNIEVEAMRIDQSGSVGIGTTTPGSGFNTEFDVVGATSLRTNSDDTAKAIVIDFIGTRHRIYTGATSGTPYDLILGTYPNGHMDQLVLQQSTGNVGIGTESPSRKLYVNGDAGGSTNWISLSDARLKKDIVTIENALDKVDSLRGVQFEWKDTANHPEGKQIGFIAQEAQKIIPEVVSKKGEHFSMQYAPITALLVEAVKKLKTESEAVRKDNIAIKAENSQLRQELLAIKDRQDAIEDMLLALSIDLPKEKLVNLGKTTTNIQ